MRARTIQQGAAAILVAIALAGAAWFVWPRAIPADMARVTRGPMEVTVVACFTGIARSFAVIGPRRERGGLISVR